MVVGRCDRNSCSLFLRGAIGSLCYRWWTLPRRGTGWLSLGAAIKQEEEGVCERYEICAHESLTNKPLGRGFLGGDTGWLRVHSETSLAFGLSSARSQRSVA
jgi:hypothetical protein